MPDAIVVEEPAADIGAKASREPILGFVAVALAVSALLMPYFAAVFFVPGAFICGIISLAIGEKKWVGIAGVTLTLVGLIGIFGVSHQINDAAQQLNDAAEKMKRAFPAN